MRFGDPAASAIASLAWRSTMSGGGWAWAACGNGALVLLALVLTAIGSPVEDAASVMLLLTPLTDLTLAAVVPFAALHFGSGVLRQEMSHGSLSLLLTTPVTRSRILATKVVVATTATVLSTLPGALLATWIVTGQSNHAVSRGLTVTVPVAALLYTAIFLLLGLATRRGPFLGFLYILLWEGALGRFFPGVAVLSVHHHAGAVADAVGVEGPVIVWRPLLLLLFSAVLLLLALRSLRRLEPGRTV